MTHVTKTAAYYAGVIAITHSSTNEFRGSVTDAPN